MYKVLVIEDEPPIRKNICDLLEIEGFEVRSAENGLKGWQAIYEQTPDLVISDILMPEMDGYELLRKLRKDATYKTVPFIFLSAKTSAEDVRIGMELGADAYVTKPFTPRQLLSAVRKIFDF